MCGIAGFTGAGDDALLARMTKSISHRGPDQESARFFPAADGAPPVRLGFRRLAVVDLAGGAQPMTDADDQATIVFNGEIYNAPELRVELEAAGFRFLTDHSDTEVALLGYLRWGEAVVDKISGMFAFCIYDRRARRLFLARDHFGKKPLYYAVVDGGFVFGSEIRCLLRHPAVDRRIDRPALARYFAYGYVPAPATLYRGVRKLPAGSTMTVDLRGGGIDIRRYWEYRMGLEPPPPGGPDRWRGELLELLTAAVRRRMIADVPLGCFLSGGVDSSAVAALAVKMTGGERLNTFTIGFVEESYDESPFADEVARALGTRHHLRTLDPAAAERMITPLLRRMDEPIADASLAPTWLLSAFTREQATAALSGDGADELFAGYDTFAALKTARVYRALTCPRARRLAEWAAARLPRSDKNLSLDFKIRRALKGAGQPPSRWLPVWLGPAGPDEVSAVMGERISPDALYADSDALWESCAGAGGDVDRSIEFFGRFYMGEGILTKVDRASMLNSLEVRSPFLDRDLARFVARLPADVKFRGGARKWLLKQALAGVVPETALNRRKKGFGIPLAAWMRRLPPPPESAVLAGEVDTAWIERRRREHVEGVEDHRHLLWAWAALSNSVDGMKEEAETSVET
jgi:asparagine synthase (glutamine-hydrolysing)